MVPPRSPMLQESVDSLVVCLPTPLEVIWSKLDNPSLRVAFVRSSANTGWGRIPTVFVEIKPAGVVGVDSWETGALRILCLIADCQTVLIKPPPSKQSALPGGVGKPEPLGRLAVGCCFCRFQGLWQQLLFARLVHKLEWWVLEHLVGACLPSLSRMNVV